MGDLTWYERDGFAWFSDGSVLPMVRGGDGEGTDGAPAPAPLPASLESAGPPADDRARNADGTFAPSAAAGGASDEPTFHDLAAEYESLAAAEGDTVTLPKDRISRWNDEHKRYRERYKPYDQAFKSLHEDDQRDILSFVQALNDETARPQAVEWMRNVLDRLSPAQQQQMANAVAAAQDAQQQPVPAPPVEDEFDPFDPAQVDARITRLVEERLTKERTEREQADATAREERAIQDRAKALGYADPRAPEYAWLLLTARNQFANDPDPLGRAHEAIEKRLNDRATEILKTKRADASQQTVPPDGAAPSGQQVPHSMKDAERAARERLDRIFTGQQS